MLVRANVAVKLFYVALACLSKYPKVREDSLD